MGNETKPAAVEHMALLVRLADLADPAYREGSLMVAPTRQRVHGVRTPASRKLAREWVRSDPDRTDTETLAVIEALWNGESRDERALGLEILCQRPDIVAGLRRSDFDRWRRDIDNWAIGDFLGYRILGPWVIVGQERLGYLDRLIGSRDVWSRRLALTATVHLSRESGDYAQATLALVDRVVDEREVMITKAVSWALRAMTDRHPADVAGYLESRGDRIAAAARREVRNKLNTGRKDGRSGAVIDT